jgi:hypothetical protein
MTIEPNVVLPLCIAAISLAVSLCATCWFVLQIGRDERQGFVAKIESLTTDCNRYAERIHKRDEIERELRDRLRTAECDRDDAQSRLDAAKAAIDGETEDDEDED